MCAGYDLIASEQAILETIENRIGDKFPGAVASAFVDDVILVKPSRCRMNSEQNPNEKAPPPVEVTPEMMKAGGSIIEHYRSDLDDPKDAARDVFLAMLDAMGRDSPCRTIGHMHMRGRDAHQPTRRFRNAR